MLPLVLIFLATPCHYISVTAKDIGGKRDGTTDNENFDALTYLEKAGYLDDLDPVKNSHHAPDNVKKALKEFQNMAGLSVTGRLDRATVSKMKEPRCGNADVIKPSQRPKEDDPNAPLSYKLEGTKWHKNELTYRIKDYTRDMPEAQQREVVAKALRMWSAVSPLNFHQQDSATVDMEVRFANKSHGDGWPFDGRGHVLAHGFKPGTRNIDGDLHFDDEETWSLDGSTPGTKSMETVAVHEIGHTLGLTHSSVRDSLMYAYYQGHVPRLHQDDIDGIHYLYGSRDTNTAPPVVDPTASFDKCDMQFDAIEQVHDKNIYVFSGPFIYTMTDDGVTGQRLISDVFKGAPSAPGAVVYDKTTNKVFFFKGRSYWRFTGYELEPTYPRNLASDFQYPDTALQKWLGDQTIYLFKGSQYTAWNEGVRNHQSGYPKLISAGWNKAPNYVDAMFQAADTGYMYMFNQDRYYRYSDMGGKQAYRFGPPKSIQPFWIGCGAKSDRDREYLFGFPKPN